MIDIVIVNWNSGELLSKCIKSVNEHNPGLVQSITIVDNASSDGSLENLRECNFPVRILSNEENRGFGAACNQGSAVATAEFILFLNPDTAIFDGTLQVPHSFMSSLFSKDVGICGVQMLDEYGDTLRHCARFPTPISFLVRALGLPSTKLFARYDTYMREWDHLSTRSVQQIIGAFFFVRRSLFEELEGFDPRFFVYFEEVDFSYRAHASGWKSMYLAEAKIFHVCGGTSRNVKAHRLFYSQRSRLIYGEKHFALRGKLLLYFVTLAVEPVTRLSLALVRGNWRDATSILHAYGMLIKHLPEIFQSNRSAKTLTKSLPERSPK